MLNSIENTSPNKYQCLSYNHTHNLPDITIEKGFLFKLILDVNIYYLTANFIVKNFFCDKYIDCSLPLMIKLIIPFNLKKGSNV